MKKTWLSLASLAVLAMAILGYTLVYASSSDSAIESAETAAVVGDEAPSKTKCSWSEKTAGEKDWSSCSKKMKAKTSCGEKKMKECRAEKSDECRRKCDDEKNDVEAAEEEAIEFN